MTKDDKIPHFKGDFSFALFSFWDYPKLPSQDIGVRLGIAWELTKIRYPRLENADILFPVDVQDRKSVV